MTIESIAKIYYAAERMCDFSAGEQTPLWEEAPDDDIEKVIDYVTYYVHNPDCTIKDIHALLVKWLDANGYVYGEVFDEEKKEHPGMTDYNFLSEEYLKSLLSEFDFIKTLLKTLEESGVVISTDY